jgi:oligopeptidase A
VKFYEVRNEKGVHIGSFYADWHPRDAKRGGAWMNYLKMGVPPSGERDRRLHLGLICGNMTPPVDGKPALLTHDEVCTVFHEFGHLLHQLCGNVEIPSLNGVSVYWDFVELPSQLLENFCWERESLDLFARHHETGEAIPQRLFKKMLAAKNYRSASDIMRQLSLWQARPRAAHEPRHHGRRGSRPTGPQDPQRLPHAAQNRAADDGASFRPPVQQSRRLCRRLLQLQMGRGARCGCVHSLPKEGVLNPAVGREFREKILSKGNSEDPAKLFHDFMGRDPDAMALLTRAGLA